MEKSTSRVWEDNELNILVDFVHNHQDIFINKMNNNIKPSEKRIKWLEVTELINSVGGKSRSSDELQRKWADWKNRTNNKLQRINKCIKQSGEGALPKKMHLTELGERVIALVPHAKKFGIPGGIDQGPIAIPVEKDSIIEESQPDNYCNGIMVTVDDGTHWGNAGGQRASANSVETTSYALLAMLQFQDYKTSGDIVKWLTSQRDGNGAFRTTQDTVVGLQALSEYSIRTASPKLDLKVSLLADQWKNNDEFKLTHENAIHQTVIRNLPVEIGKKELTIKVTGQGSGRMMIDLRYNRHGTKNERCGFTVSDIIVSEVNELNQNIEKQGLMECDVCSQNCDRIPDLYEIEDDVLEPIPRGIIANLGRKKRSRGKRVSSVQRCTEFSVSTVSGSTGMAVVMFGLETGVEIISSDIDKLIKETDNIDAYENDGKGFVVFYLSEITTAETRFKFRLKDTFDDKAGKLSRQPAVVTVYDYYNPDLTCTKMYRSIGETFSMKCDNSSSSMTCQCMSNLCPSDLGDKLEEQARKQQRPALQLKRYTCNIDHADFAVLVEIDASDYDADRKEKRYNAIVTKSIHQGKHDLTDEEIVLIFPMDCKFPNFEIGKEYYIIGKESTEEYEYVLSSSTLIIEKPRSRSMINSIMKKYENFMGRGCDD